MNTNDPTQPTDEFQQVLHRLAQGTATIVDLKSAANWLRELYTYHGLPMAELEKVPIYRTAEKGTMTSLAPMINLKHWIERLMQGGLNDTERKMRPEANKRQVGGAHYRSPHQHWDFVVGAKIGYLGAQAMRYVSRWRKKDGVEGLQKGDHFLEKMIEVHSSNPPRISLDDYAEANALNEQEKMVIGLIESYERTKDILLLHAARALVAVLLQGANQPPPAAPK